MNYQKNFNLKSALNISNTQGLLIIFGVIIVSVASLFIVSGQYQLVTLTVFLLLGVIFFIYPFWGIFILAFFIPLESSFLGFFGGIFSLNKFLGIFVFVVWFVRTLINRQKILIPKPFKIGILFLGWAFLSIFWSWDSNASISRFLTGLQLFFFSLLIINLIRSYKDIKIILVALISGSFLLTLFGLFGFNSASEDWLLTLSGQGAKEFASYVGLVVLYCTYFIWKDLNSKKILLGFMVLSSMYPLFASGERGIIVALILTWFSILLYFRTSTKVLLVYGLLIVGLIFVPLWLNQLGLISDWIAERFTFQNVLESGGSGRIEIYSLGFEIFKDNPLLGTGLGTFKTASEIFQSALINDVGITKGIDSHGDWMGVLADLGIIGFVIYCSFLYSIGVNLVRYFIHSNDENKTQTIFVLFLFVYVLSVGLLSTYMWRKIYWLTLGFALVVPELLSSYSNTNERITRNR